MSKKKFVPFDKTKDCQIVGVRINPKTDVRSPIIRLNPAQRGLKYATELHTGCNAITGEKLSARQKAWRAGFMAARQEQQRIYNWQENQKKKK